MSIPASEAAANMPDIWLAEHRLLVERAGILFIGGTKYPETESFYVVHAARLADQTTRAWTTAKAALAQYTTNPQLVTLYDGTTELEEFIITFARLVSFVGALEQSCSVPTDKSVARGSLVERLKDFRNRLIHGDEDIRDGRAGKGLATGTLEIRPLDVVIQTKAGGDLISIDYRELADALSECRRFLLEVIQR